MATLTITIPDAAVSRVQDAFGHATGDVVPGWEPATNAELRQIIMNFIRNRVRAYEEEKASIQARAAVIEI